MGVFSRDKAQGSVLMFAVHDSAQGFMMPLYFAAEAVAIRTFGDAVNGGDKNISSHAQDFSLYRLGSYEPTTGLLYPISPELVISAASLVNQNVSR